MLPYLPFKAQEIDIESGLASIRRQLAAWVVRLHDAVGPAEVGTILDPSARVGSSKS